MICEKLRIGYVPLADAALLLIAAAQNFDRAEGLIFDLVAENSWANIRDKLTLGIFDAAHILWPAAIATHVGLAGAPTPLLAPMALGLDGNAISVSHDLYREILAEIDSEADARDPAVTARALAKIVGRRNAAGAPKLSFAHVFPYSMHHYQLRAWLKLGGLSADNLRLSVTPPPFMAQSLIAGHIDGFCVGEPWNALVATSGAGHVLHPARALRANCPEKLLAFRLAFAEERQDTLARAAKAIARAAEWTNAPENRAQAARIVADAFKGAVAPEIIAALFAPTQEQEEKNAPPILRLDLAATKLHAAQAQWVAEQMVAAGQADPTPAFFKAAAALSPPTAD